MRRWLKRIVIVFAVFVLPPVAFYFYTAWQGERKLCAVLEELDANEAPWRWDDLQNSRPPLAPEDDVRPLVVKIASLMPRNFDTRTPRDGAERPNLLLWPAQLQSYSADLEEADEALVLARNLARMPRGRLQIHCRASDLPALSYDDVGKARSAANLLRVSAIYDAHQGDLDSAMEKCLALQRLSAALDEYGMINHLVRVALQATALGALERVLGQGQPAPAHLEQLQQAWEKFDSNHSLTAAFRGERAYSHALFENVAAGKVSMQEFMGRPKGSLSWEETFNDLQIRYTLKQSHAWSLRYLNAVLEALEMPEADRSVRLRELEKQLYAAPTAASIVSPVFSKMLEAHQRSEVRRRCAVVGLACERFRRAHDRWPQTVDELSPKYLARIPEDPHSGRPLQLRATVDGIVIHSIGPDGKLRGAYHDAQSPNGLHAGYEFRLWNVNQRRQVDVRQP